MLTADDVVDYLGLDPTDTGTDRRWLDDVVAAVNETVAALPIIADRAAPDDPWPARALTGATMLAGHIYQARNSPYGRPQLDGGFAPAYADPEIARMLNLRRYTRAGMWA